MCTDVYRFLVLFKSGRPKQEYFRFDSDEEAIESAENFKKRNDQIESIKITREFKEWRLISNI